MNEYLRIEGGDKSLKRVSQGSQLTDLNDIYTLKTTLKEMENIKTYAEESSWQIALAVRWSERPRERPGGW